MSRKREGKKKETKDGEGKWHFEYLFINLFDRHCMYIIYFWIKDFEGKLDSSIEQLVRGSKYHILVIEAKEWERTIFSVVSKVVCATQGCEEIETFVHCWWEYKIE